MTKKQLKNIYQTLHPLPLGWLEKLVRHRAIDVCDIEAIEKIDDEAKAEEARLRVFWNDYYTRVHRPGIEKEYLFYRKQIVKKIKKERKEYAKRFQAGIQKQESYRKYSVLDEFLDRIGENSKKRGGVSDEDVRRAKEYPIHAILDIPKSTQVIRCINPSHDDGTPSMWIKNNWAYCFGCGWSGDVIKVYRAVHGGGFVDGVRALCC